MFEKGKRIPSCQLLAMYEGETQTHLAHPVKLTGAKDPYNVFMICISSHGMLIESILFIVSHNCLIITRYSLL